MYILHLALKNESSSENRLNCVTPRYDGASLSDGERSVNRTETVLRLKKIGLIHVHNYSRKVKRGSLRHVLVLLLARNRLGDGGGMCCGGGGDIKYVPVAIAFVSRPAIRRPFQLSRLAAGRCCQLLHRVVAREPFELPAGCCSSTFK